MRVRRRRVAVVALLSVVVLGAAGVWLFSSKQSPLAPPCQVSVGSESYSLDLEQAANATTIAALGKRLGLADHAVTIALAAALQESGLHNLSHGDLDSVGLFQQRPSQGWGTSAQILVPRYAATAFYQRLGQVPGWETMAVTDAAQAVQHSAAPNAYAQWEAEARVLARALTGEAPAGLACSFAPAGGPILSAELNQAVSLEVGNPAFGVSVPAARGWTVASWLVGHASQFRIASVTFGGQRWTPGQQAWVAGDPATDRVQVA